MWCSVVVVMCGYHFFQPFAWNKDRAANDLRVYVRLETGPFYVECCVYYASVWLYVPMRVRVSARGAHMHLPVWLTRTKTALSSKGFAEDLASSPLGCFGCSGSRRSSLLHSNRIAASNPTANNNISWNITSST